MATILVVDDSDALRLLFRCVLSGNGHTVVEASHGVEAISLIKQKRPDMILMDVDMPILDGLATLRLIKEQQSYNDIKIIITTGSSEKGLLEEALATGCDWFLQKPFTIEQLRECVAELLMRGEEVRDGRFLLSGGR